MEYHTHHLTLSIIILNPTMTTRLGNPWCGRLTVKLELREGFEVSAAVESLQFGHLLSQGLLILCPRIHQPAASPGVKVQGVSVSLHMLVRYTSYL